MAYAAMTFVYNEAINLPIWLDYYGALFGRSNLFVIDRSSTDGSTDGLGDVNLIRIPRSRFDEDAKTNLMSSFHAGLTSIYEAVVVTDCDEIIVPDPGHYADLNEYLGKLAADHVNAVGIDIVHMISQELPLDLSRPILSQRAYGRFHAPECKHLVSRVPTRWLPGLHSSDKPPNFDDKLFILHLKLMDYGFAMGRQRVNLDTEWSDASLAVGYGAHHRWDLGRFVHQCFFVPIDLVNRKQVGEFDFRTEIDEMLRRTVIDPDGNHRVPMDIAKMVMFPERFRTLI